MKTQKGQIESKFVKENSNGHVYRSVTSYDEYQDTVEYAVNKSNGESLGRYKNEETAIKVFDQNLK